MPKRGTHLFIYLLMNSIYFSFSGYATLLEAVLDGEKYTGCDCISLSLQ